MTFDLLLIALAALVASNVVLLVAATRSGATQRDAREPGHPVRPRASEDRIEWAALPVGEPATVASRIAADGLAAGPRTVAARVVAPSAVAAGVVSSSVVAEGTAPHASAVTVPSAPPETPTAALVPAPEPPPIAPARSAPARRSASARADVRRTGGAKRGRRFTLPSIEVDHERTERVVLSLLTGDDEIALAAEGADDGDAAGGHMVDAWERLVGSDAAGEPARAAVVVALTLDGLDRLVEIAGRDAADRAVGAALDAIRRSARGSDRVASVGRGHFRVLLVDADDAVAARFVARVRETLERRPVLATANVALAAGWAEAHTAGHLEGAVHAAEERRRTDMVLPRRAGDGSSA